MFGIELDPLDAPAVIGALLARAREGRPGFVVTANLWHALWLRRDQALRRTFAEAAFVVADGHPIVWMARLRGIRMRLVAGADLVLPLCRAAAREGRSIFLFGTRFEILAECGRKLSASIEGLRIAGVYSPPFGFDQDPNECAIAVGVIEAAAPDFVLVGLGVPKQEIWAQKNAARLRVQAVCLGASLDFIAGAQRRAPRLFRRIGLEWAWRMLTNPRRLAARYLSLLCWLPVLVVGELVVEARRQWTRSR